MSRQNYRHLLGHGLGLKLVQFSLALIKQHICRRVGCRFVVVDAKQDSEAKTPVNRRHRRGGLMKPALFAVVAVALWGEREHERLIDRIPIDVQVGWAAVAIGWAADADACRLRRLLAARGRRGIAPSEGGGLLYRRAEKVRLPAEADRVVDRRRLAAAFGHRMRNIIGLSRGRVRAVGGRLIWEALVHRHKPLMVDRRVAVRERIDRQDLGVIGRGHTRPIQLVFDPRRHGARVLELADRDPLDVLDRPVNARHPVDMALRIDRHRQHRVEPQVEDIVIVVDPVGPRPLDTDRVTFRVPYLAICPGFGGVVYLEP